jgi:transposase
VDTGTFAVKESTMGKSRRKYPAEFRRQLVELARAGRSAEDLAREFGPSRESIRLWVLEAEREERDIRALKPDERTELERLRRENRQLRLERDILSKATAWFARETTGIPPKDSSS